MPGRVSTKKTDDILIQELREQRLVFAVLGRTPIILNRMPAKVMGTLIFPGAPVTMATKRSRLKHDPYEEFQNSPYRIENPDAPTLLAVPASAFKGAIATAALDVEGARKTEIGRRVFVEADWDGRFVALYGEPKIFTSVTRQADINHTPDVRTRAIVPEWAAVVTVRYPEPALRQPMVQNLFAAAGMVAGVGDWRPEKGSGDFGQFRLVSVDDPDFVRIVGTWGRAAQASAMADPECYDGESRELLSWFDSEAVTRGFTVSGKLGNALGGNGVAPGRSGAANGAVPRAS